ncbi:MAG: class I SAM-dependent methyltransferase [Phaeodactylibacter sp.]|uniref:O-methyltransferase n=1 Tax=Phaeodactylibacter sp. TaxID=1940289 RepID=UPI0032EFAB1A
MKWIKLYLRLLLRYLQYFLRARTRYTLHAPFAFQLAEAILEDDRQFYAFRDIELLRRGLLKNQNHIRIQDHGAGSLVSTAAQRTVRSIARYSAISPESGQLLFRLVDFSKPQRMLELGTSLGISGAYQASGAQSAKLISIEGCPQTAALARQNFHKLNLHNVEVFQGTFQSQLPLALQQLGQLDYLYLDGDHRKGASLAYFEACLPYLHERSVVVVADIYWSNEMESAWRTLQQYDRVRLTVDLFHFGLLFFRPEQKVKTQLTLIQAKYKPWQMGFFSSSD